MPVLPRRWDEVREPVEELKKPAAGRSSGPRAAAGPRGVYPVPAGKTATWHRNKKEPHP
jgi:hypothetical protein